MGRVHHRASIAPRILRIGAAAAVAAVLVAACGAAHDGDGGTAENGGRSHITPTSTTASQSPTTVAGESGQHDGASSDANGNGSAGSPSRSGGAGGSHGSATGENGSAGSAAGGKSGGTATTEESGADCSGDQDCDGVKDVADNCVSTPNRDQYDKDQDKRGDACDEDDLDDRSIGELVTACGAAPAPGGPDIQPIPDAIPGDRAIPFAELAGPLGTGEYGSFGALVCDSGPSLAPHFYDGDLLYVAPNNAYRIYVVRPEELDQLQRTPDAVELRTPDAGRRLSRDVIEELDPRANRIP